LENIFESGDQTLINEHLSLLNPRDATPSIIKTIQEALRDETNLKHVRCWKALSCPNTTVASAPNDLHVEIGAGLSRSGTTLARPSEAADTAGRLTGRNTVVAKEGDDKP